MNKKRIIIILLVVLILLIGIYLIISNEPGNISILKNNKNEKTKITDKTDEVSEIPEIPVDDEVTENQNEDDNTLINDFETENDITKTVTSKVENNTTTTTKKDSNKTTTKNDSNKTTTTKTITTTNQTTKTVSNTNNFKSTINGVSLKPSYTRYTELDNRIGSILSQTINNGMSNYDKLIAVYDYLKRTMSYGYPSYNLNDLNNLINTYHYTGGDAQKLLLAKFGLDNKNGTCDVYAAMFTIMARRIGFDAYVFNGQVRNADGSKTGHGWSVIKVGNKYYNFDAQIEDSLGTNYKYFGKTDSEMNIYYYNLNDNLSYFNKFKEVPAFEATFKTTGAASLNKNAKSYTTITEKDYIDVYVGDTINITINVNSSNTRYSISSYINYSSKTLVSKTTTDKTINFSYKFENRESGEIRISVVSNDHEGSNISYNISYNATSKNPLTDFTYKRSTDEHNYETFTMTPIGGIGGIQYDFYLIETDDEKCKNSTITSYMMSNGQNTLYFKPLDGKYYKLNIIAKDSKNNIVKKEVIIQR